MALADDILAPGAGRDVPIPCAGTFRLLYTYTEREREIEREICIYIYTYVHICADTLRNPKTSCRASPSAFHTLICCG